MGKELFDKRQRFSIRKFSVGVASVMVGATLVGMNTNSVAADEVATNTDASSTETPKASETVAIESSKAETSTYAAPAVEVKAETAAVEAPKAETAKTEESKAVEAPKAEASAVEAPKAEAAKTEAPKAAEVAKTEEAPKTEVKSETKVLTKEEKRALAFPKQGQDMPVGTALRADVARNGEVTAKDVKDPEIKSDVRAKFDPNKQVEVGMTADKYVFGLYTLNSKANTQGYKQLAKVDGYYVRTSKERNNSLDVTVELVEKGTNTVVESTKVALGQEGELTKFSDWTNGELKYHIFNISKGSEGATVILRALEVQPTTDENWDKVYTSESFYHQDMLEVTNPTREGTEIKAPAVNVPRLVDTATLYKVVNESHYDKANKAGYTPDGTEKLLEKLDGKALEGQVYYTEKPKDFAGYEFVKGVVNPSGQSVIGKYKVGDFYVDGFLTVDNDNLTKVANGLVYEIVGEDGSAKLSVYQLNPAKKNQAVSSNDASKIVNSDAYVKIFETKVLKAGETFTGDGTIHTGTIGIYPYKYVVKSDGTIQFKWLENLNDTDKTTEKYGFGGRNHRLSNSNIQPTDAVYYYAPVYGDVLVHYVDLNGTTIKVDYKDTDHKQAETAYSTKENTNEKPTEIAFGGNIYELVTTATTMTDGTAVSAEGVKAGSAAEVGKVVAEKTLEVTYVYKLKEEPVKPEVLKGDVIVKYVLNKDGSKLADDEVDTKQADAGTAYETYDHKHQTLTKDGVTYKLVTTNDGVYQGQVDGKSSDPQKGEVEGNATKVIIYAYEKVETPVTPKGSVVVHYVEDGNETHVLRKDYLDTDNKDAGTKYDTTEGDERPTEIVEDGKTYVRTARVTGPETGTVIGNETIHVTYYYKLKEEPVTPPTPEKPKGSVIVHYVEEGNESNILRDTYKDTTDKEEGTEYNTTEGDERPSEIIKDGKTYIRTSKVTGPETGTVIGNKTIEVTYYYKLKEEPKVETPKGSVIVHYVDESGKTISKDYVDTNNKDEGTEYNTAENKLEKPDVIAFEGNDYEFVKYDKEISAPEQGKVEGNKTLEVTYVYKLKEKPTPPTPPTIVKPEKDVAKEVGGVSVNGVVSHEGHNSVTFNGETVYFKVEGSKLTAGKGYEYKTDLVYKDTLDKKVSFVKVEDSTASADIKMKDGSVIKAGESIKAYVTDTFDANTNTVTITISKDFLNKIDEAAGFQYVGYITAKAIEGGTVVNTFDQILNKQTETSNKVTVEVPTPKPEKHNYSDAEHKNNIDGKQTLRGQVNHYEAVWNKAPFKGMLVTSEATKLLQAFIDDYDENVVTPLVDQFKIKDAAGKEVNGLQLFHVLAGQEQNELVKKVLGMYKEKGFTPNGDFLLWVAGADAAGNVDQAKVAEHINKYNKEGLDLHFDLPMQNKEDATNEEYTNSVAQVDFSTASVGNIVENFLNKPTPKKDINKVVDGASIDGSEAQIGDEVLFQIIGSTFKKDRGYIFTEDLTYVDALDKKVKYVGFEDAKAPFDVKLANGSVIKKGDSVAKYVTVGYKADTHTVYVSINKDFLNSIAQDSEYQFIGHIKTQAVKAGKVENVIDEYINGVKEKTNKVTITIPTPPTSPEKDVTKELGGVSVNGAVSHKEGHNSITYNGETVYFKVAGSKLVAGKDNAYSTDLVFKDTLDNKVEYVGVEESKAAADIQLKDGRVIKAGESIAKHVTVDFNKNTNTVTITVAKDFLNNIDNEAEFQYVGYIKAKAIKGGTVENTFDQIVNKSYESSNKVTIDIPTPKPEKHNYSDAEHKNNIDGKQTLRGQVNHYEAVWNKAPFKGMHITSEASKAIQAFIDDYDENVVTPLVDQFKIKDAEGKEVNGLQLFHVLAGQEQNELVKKVLGMYKEKGFTPNGDFLLWVAGADAAGNVDQAKVAEHINKYNKEGLDLHFDLPMQNKVDATNERYTNSVAQVDFSTASVGNVVENFLNKPNPKKDINKTVDGASIDGSEAKIGDEVLFKIIGSVFKKDRGYTFTENLTYVDQLDPKVKYVGFEDSKAPFDITLNDGTVIKKGDSISKYVTVGYSQEKHTVYVTIDKDFLNSISQESQYQYVGYIKTQAIASGTVENVIDEYINGVKERTNKVTIHIPTPPTPPTPNKPKEPTPPTPNKPGEPTPPTPEKPVLPNTGESSSAGVMVMAGVAALSALGLAASRKKED